jgi:L-malate glycosyltransferase
MRVLHVVSGDLYAGAERITEELAVAQREYLRLQVSAAVLNEGRLAANLRCAGVETHVLDERHCGAAALCLALRGLVARIRPDVVHTHRFKENVLGALAAAGRAPSIRTVHGAPEFLRSRSVRDHLIQTMDRFAARRLQSRIVSVSDELSDRLRAIYPGRKPATVLNGIDAGRVQAAAASSVPELEGNIRVGVFARLVPVKRVDLAIEAIAHARRQLSRDVVLHIFGEGPLESNLREQAAGRREIVFHGNCAQALAYLRQMDALLLTSSHEGLPVVVLESMILSVPVVATATGGIPHVLAHGSCGWLVSPEADPAGYARALIEAVCCAELRRARISAARERVERQFCANRMARDYFDLYREVCGETGA